jgi:hypothetical protein
VVFLFSLQHCLVMFFENKNTTKQCKNNEKHHKTI